jgi:hypothetical protein
MVIYVTNITRGNYNRRKENRITVSSRILNHNNLYTWRWPVRPKRVVSIKEYEERIVNDVAHRRHKSCKSQ